MTGVFAQHAPAYLQAGIPCIPVDTKAKKPHVLNWKKMGKTATSALIDKFGDADGIGICMGQKTGIVEVDVDAEGDAALDSAIGRFGDTPIKIGTASGKWKLWYRHDGEGRNIRAIDGLPIDILGDGLTIAPPSYRPDLGMSYRFLTGSLSDVRRLPGIRAGALPAASEKLVAETVVSGVRNKTLFHWCMSTARCCDDVNTLIDAALTWNSSLPNPLSHAEVKKTARSAWRYEEEDRNFVGLARPQVTRGDRVMDDLIDQVDALVLLSVFKRFHSNKDSFAIAPKAMSEASYPPWHWTRISKARDVLVERDYLEVLSEPSAGRRKAGQYRLTEKWSDSVHNHYTPLLLVPPVGRAA